jgi:hypothetical protein
MQNGILRGESIYDRIYIYGLKRRWTLGTGLIELKNFHKRAIEALQNFFYFSETYLSVGRFSKIEIPLSSADYTRKLFLIHSVTKSLSLYVTDYLSLLNVSYRLFFTRCPVPSARRLAPSALCPYLIPKISGNPNTTIIIQTR